MSKFKILGLKPISFINSTGDLIEGTNIYVGYADEQTTGMMTDKFFVKPEIEIPQVKIGDNLNIFFNQKGKIEAIMKE